jgi:hypothetical protein
MQEDSRKELAGRKRRQAPEPIFIAVTDTGTTPGARKHTGNVNKPLGIVSRNGGGLLRTSSRFIQKQVDHPTATCVPARLAAVSQNVFMMATRFHQGVRQDGQVLEAPFIVDGLGELRDGGVIPHQPTRVHDNKSERVAQEFPPQVT